MPNQNNAVKPTYERSKVILDIKHLTKQFKVDDGRLLTACNDISLRAYEGKT